jgi:hypothetical protein
VAASLRLCIALRRRVAVQMMLVKGAQISPWANGERY